MYYSNPNTDCRFNSRKKYTSQAALLTYTRCGANAGLFLSCSSLSFIASDSGEDCKRSNAFTIPNYALISDKIFHPSRRHSAVLEVGISCFPFFSCIQLTDQEQMSFRDDRSEFLQERAHI